MPNDHLTRPGPQPHNQIAGTAEEQFQRVFRPRLAEPLTLAEAHRFAEALVRYPEVFRPLLIDLLATDIAVAIGVAIGQRLRRGA